MKRHRFRLSAVQGFCPKLGGKISVSSGSKEAPLAFTCLTEDVV
jgi:hypothetical protein